VNNKGSAIFVYFMIGIVLFVLALALAPVLTDTTDEARSTSLLNCSDSSISNQDKAVCYQLDSIPPFYLAILFGLGGLVLSRIIS